MHTSLTLRPFATASVALVSASAIALSPVAPEPVLPDIKVADPAVQLTAAVDPITPWLETFNTAETNLASLVDKWLEAPAPVLQQVIANQIRYLSQLPDFPVILEQVVANLGAAIRAPFAIDTSTLENTNPLLNHRSLFTILQELGDASPIPPALQPLIDFSTTYTSGILLGLVGPVIGPVLALAASATAIVENLTGEAPDLEAALGTLINTPASMVDAFLNGGQTLDLTPVLDALGLNLDPAPGTDVTKVGITFGGLLSPGGSIFNALEFDITIAGVINVNIPGNGPGFVGSLIGLSQAIAKAIGWDGEGNPLAPPLTTPETELRQAADASIVEATTVTLETVDETAASTSEPSAAPAVSTTDEETTEEEAEEPATEESASDESEEAEDAASEESEESASEESEQEAETDAEGDNLGSRDGDDDADDSSATKAGQNDSSDSSDSSDSGSSDS